MRKIYLAIAVLFTSTIFARPQRYTELLEFVQAAPDQGETNTCWFVASTGAMELLLNRRDNIKTPKPNGKNDLAESFLIYQKDYFDNETHQHSFIETVLMRFNYEVAIHNSAWPFNAYYPDGTNSMEAWWKHPHFNELPRIQVPKIKTKLLFSKGRRRWATDVLEEADLELMRETLAEKKAPLIVNYNDDGYWHVILIVGYDDERVGDCYQIKEHECNERGAFIVRDSNGIRFEARAYNWFLHKGNAAALVDFK